MKLEPDIALVAALIGDPARANMLVALMAPRPVLICSAVEDRWVDVED